MKKLLTLFSIGPFGAANVVGGGREGKSPPRPEICLTYPAMMKFGTVIPYLKKIQKTCKLLNTPTESC